MLNLTLSGESHHPLYMQLYSQIRNQIRSGIITDGIRLPSVRSLQLQLNISKTTIETAYQMLLAEGYAVSKPRSGLYAVNPHGIKPSLPPNDPSNLDSVDSIATPTPQNCLIDFKTSAVDEPTFPIRTWRRMLQSALENSAENLCQYGDPQGEYSFRNVLAEYLRKSRGVVCLPEQIVIGSGIQYSIGILAKLFSNRHHIAFEEPGFAPVREQFKQNGFHLTPISIQDRGLSLEELDNSEAQAVYVTPSHQFPTGSVIPYTEREYLLNWARSRNAYIIEDDYDGEYRYFGKPFPSLQGLDRDGRVIYVGTFSKVFTPALRMNYMVLPMELLKKMRSMHYLLDSPSRIEQWAMQSFIEQGHWYRHIRRMRNTYRKKHHRFIELILTNFADQVEITGHSAGLHIQVTIKTRQPAEVLMKLAADEGVRVYDFHEMWMKPNHSGYPQIYMGFGGISERDMEIGIQLLRKAWRGIVDH